MLLYLFAQITTYPSTLMLNLWVEPNLTFYVHVTVHRNKFLCNKTN